MSRPNRRAIAAAAGVLMLGAVSSAAAQECASAPLLGGRAAAGLAVAHASDESSGEVSVIAGLGSRVRATGSYRATRLDDVDRLRHEGRLAAARPFAVRSLALCPVAGASYARLSTDRTGAVGQVTTREAWAGAELGRTIALPHAFALMPFVQPMVVRRSVSWRSTEAGWAVVDDEAATSAQLWLGMSLATRRSAAIARFRPGSNGRRAEIELGVVSRLGWR